MNIFKIRKALEEILNIIDFPETQKKDTIFGIIDLINEYSLIRLLQGLDKKVQDQFRELISERKEDNREFILSFIGKYYSTDAIEKVIEEEAKELIYDYLHQISPLILDSTKDQIKNLLNNSL